MDAPHAGDVHAALGQALERNLSQRVVANQRLEPDAASQSRQIVGHDGGRTAQGKHHAVSQQFTLGRKLVRQAIKDEVEVQFSGDGDVKTWHVSGHYRRCGLERALAEKRPRICAEFTRVKQEWIGGPGET